MTLPPNESATPALGRVVATERKPNTPHEFHFWTALDSPVGIGTIVRVQGDAPVNGQIPQIYGVVVEGFSYTDLATPLHDVLGHDGAPTSASLAATRARGDPAVHRGGAPADPRGTAATGGDGPGVSRRRPGRGSRAAHGRVSARRRAHGHPDRRVPRRRHRRADLPRRRFPDRTRGGAPEHHRCVGACDEDERDRVDHGLDLHALSRRRKVRSRRCASTSKGRTSASWTSPARSTIGTRPSTKSAASRHAVRERPVLRAVQIGRVLAQHPALQRRADAQCDAAHMGPSRGAAVRRGAAQQGRRRREGRRADRLHSRADRGPRFLRSAPREQTLPRPLVRRSRDVVPRRALGHGEQGERGVADAPRGDDPQGSEPAFQYFDPVRRASHGRRDGQRPAVRELSGPHGVRDRRRLARGGRAGSDLRARRHASFASTSRSATSA